MKLVSDEYKVYRFSKGPGSFVLVKMVSWVPKRSTKEVRGEGYNIDAKMWP